LYVIIGQKNHQIVPSIPCTNSFKRRYIPSCSSENTTTTKETGKSITTHRRHRIAGETMAASSDIWDMNQKKAAR